MRVWVLLVDGILSAHPLSGDSVRRATVAHAENPNPDSLLFLTPSAKRPGSGAPPPRA